MLLSRVPTASAPVWKEILAICVIISDFREGEGRRRKRRKRRGMIS